MMATTLCTQRLTLEPLTLADIQAIYAIAKERQSIEDFQYVASSVDDVKAWLEPSYHDPTQFVWIIRKEGHTIGLFEVCFEAEYSDLEDKVCRIGYFLDFREHNQGYATEVLLTVRDWLFGYMDVERIEAGVTLCNIPSYRVLEKAGFTREKIVKGNWRWYGKFYDSAYYYLLKTSTI
ncbi:GNAT family protein [Acaryochloris sp. IP29b_bin.137]|uniref:GNAT family N-acetyltransferase n=1 Tax=Acaryochloris sp. IP29b_bin.137 TaxID=2969217 RepID=UPI00261EA26F|nr:GNAT family protein [Acaryochloris sp. IP29b_bin.137]